MYCKNCGKYIGDERDLCDDCLASLNTASAPINGETTPIEEEVTSSDFGQNNQVNDEPFADFNQNTQVQTQPTYAQPLPQKSGKIMDGFGKALTAIILGFFAFIFSELGLSIIDSALVSNVYYTQSELADAMLTGVIFALLVIGLSIPALILGIKSIKFGNNAKNENRVKPIPAFVMGIVSTVLSGLSLFLCFIIFIISIL